MALHTVFRTNKLEGDLGFGVIEVDREKYPVTRTSPLYGDFGNGIVKVNGKTYPVYRTKKEDGDNGYGVVNVRDKWNLSPTLQIQHGSPCWPKVKKALD